MATKDLYENPFDDGTLDKLKIFEDYFKEWLPVFISKEDPIWKEIRIFDLFAGKGKDNNGVFGSPLRILQILNNNKNLIIKSKVKIQVICNEYKKKNYDSLVKNLESIADRTLYELNVLNEDFLVVFNRYYDAMNNSANFLFLDQNGIKNITREVFLKLISLKKTDFLFFISSSYIKRFGEVEDFKKYLSITKQDLANKSYYHIHRIVISFYRSLVPARMSYHLAPFSIRKPAGIYGLIFGSNHTYGMEKFLSVCWKHDKLTGEANFDIDSEKIDLFKPALFPELNIPSKRQLFEQHLIDGIMRKNLISNIEVYLFTLNEGFLLKDANVVLKRLLIENKITFDFKLIASRMHKEISSPIKLLGHG